MTKRDPSDLITTAALLLSKARHVVVFTGAGISTPSGIPDFRSKNTGLWNRDDPMIVASLTGFRMSPQRFYNWLRPILLSSMNAIPNPAHAGLYQLEEMGVVKSIITQNIDGLHQKAGSKTVIELHGSLNTFTCQDCNQRTDQSRSAIDSIISNQIPICSICGGILKPDIILFEEDLPQREWRLAKQEALSADVLMVAGSSLEVIPASSIPFQALQHGAKMIVVNYTSTFLDDKAAVVFHEDVAEIIPAIVQEIRIQICQ